MVKIVHAADLHLDSPLRGLERYEGAPVEQLRGATRRALENLVELCLDEQARLLLLAGDLYDGDWRDYSTGLFFSAQMARLRQADVQVVWIRGNHDAQSRITRHLRLPDNVRELSAKEPDSALFEPLGVAVHGRGFPTARVTQDLSASYPAPARDLFNVGLLHTALSGREGHAPYAPCEVEALVARGYDYWALGHVHRREVVRERPWVVFPGNLQGRHVREAGAKGATLITLDDLSVARVEHRALDVVRWVHCEVDVGEAHSALDAVELCRQALERHAQAADGRTLAARLSLRGACPAHDELARDPERWQAALRGAAADLGGGEVWVEKIRFQTRAALDLAGLAARGDAIGQLVRSIAELRAGVDDEEGEWREQLRALERALPAELRGGDAALGLDDPQVARELLDEVEQLLLPRLLEAAR